jgi:hypothetical protein
MENGIMRQISEIASEINSVWKNVHFSALPYLRAMEDLRTTYDRYGVDDGASVVRYFLSNASHWRGADARRIKAELREMID